MNEMDGGALLPPSIADQSENKRSKYGKGRHPNSLAALRKHHFKKGQPGNPKGRRPGSSILDMILKVGEFSRTEKSPSSRPKESAP